MSTSMLRNEFFEEYVFGMKFSDFLRESLRKMSDDTNLNKVAKKAQVDRSQLARFLEGERGLSVESVEKILDNLKFQIFAPEQKIGATEEEVRGKLAERVMRVMAENGVDRDTRALVYDAICGIEEKSHGNIQKAAGDR